MSSKIVSHSTEAMNNWAKTRESDAEDFDTMVNELYSLIDQFVGTDEFRGGLAEDLRNNLDSYKSEFRKYSTTFREASDVMKKNANKIETNDAMHKRNINAANPMQNR